MKYNLKDFYRGKLYDVYLPPNTNWLHVFTHVAYQGGSGEVGKNVTMESPIGTPILLQRMNYTSTTNGVAMKVANAMHAYWKEEQLLLLSSQH